jgi:hypothetical protein
MVERERVPGESAVMAGPPPVKLEPRDRQRLERLVRQLRALEERTDATERAFAALVRELGISACARELGVSRQALRARILRIERRETRR